MINNINDKIYFGSIRKEILEFIPESVSTLIDFGCGYGKTAKFIKDNTNVKHVTGVEINKEAFQESKKEIDSVYNFDLNNPAELKKNLNNKYDVVLILDVLEHLESPHQFLLSIKYICHTNTHIILSIPNVRHYTVLFPLLFKNAWQYKDAGILDKTHRWFFTLNSIKVLLEECGYKIITFKTKKSVTRPFLIFNILTFGIFRSFSIFQYIIKCKL